MFEVEEKKSKKNKIIIFLILSVVVVVGVLYYSFFVIDVGYFVKTEIAIPEMIKNSVVCGSSGYSGISSFSVDCPCLGKSFTDNRMAGGSPTYCSGECSNDCQCNSVTYESPGGNEIVSHENYPCDQKGKKIQK